MRAGLLRPRPRPVLLAAALLPVLLPALLLALLPALPGCMPEGGEGERADIDGNSEGEGVYGDRVVDYQPMVAEGLTEAEWPYFFHPEAALGAPGDLHSVASLGYDPLAAGR